MPQNRHLGQAGQATKLAITSFFANCAVSPSGSNPHLPTKLAILIYVSYLVRGAEMVFHSQGKLVLWDSKPFP